MGEKGITQLLSDIIENEWQSYYLGNIVIKSQHFETIIVDGQQRITTLILIIKALSTMPIDEVYMQKYLKNTIESSYLNGTGVGNSCIEKILNDKILTEEEVSTNYVQNYELIKKYLAKYDPMDILKQMEKVQFAYIGLDRDIDEHIVFAQINSTGKKLTAFDLTKNFLLSKVKNEAELDSYIEKLNYSTDGFTCVEKDGMLRHFVASNTGELIKKDSTKIYEEIKKIYFNDKNVIDDIITFATYYKFYIKNKEECCLLVPDMLLNSFNTFAVLLVDILSSVSEIKKGNIIIHEKFEFKKTCEFLEIYKIRRTFTNMKEKEITRYIPKLKLEVNKQSVGTYYDKLEKILLTEANEKEKDNGYRMPRKAEFEKQFAITSIYNEPKFVKSLLARLEMYGVKEEINFSNFTIEHILPQTLTNIWIEELGDETYEAYSYLHTIGNLTITADNSELSNKSFVEKKEILQKKSRAKLNTELLTYDLWDSNAILDRANHLLEKINEIWNINEV